MSRGTLLGQSRGLLDVRILLKMKHLEALAEAALQLDIVCRHQHLGVRAQRFQHRFGGRNPLGRVGAAKQLIDQEYPAFATLGSPQEREMVSMAAK